MWDWVTIFCNPVKQSAETLAIVRIASEAIFKLYRHEVNKMDFDKAKKKKKEKKNSKAMQLVALCTDKMTQPLGNI